TGSILLLLGSKAILDGFASREWGAVVGSFANDLGETYEYRVADSTYSGSRLRFAGLPFCSRVRTVGADREGIAVRVYYDPSRPGNALLRPGVQGSAVAICGAGILLVILAAVLPTRHRRRRQAATRSLEA